MTSQTQNDLVMGTKSIGTMDVRLTELHDGPATVHFGSADRRKIRRPELHFGDELQRKFEQIQRLEEVKQ
jgi:hypothetical protein